MAKPEKVVIEDSFGNTIILSNGKITIQGMAVLELKAPTVIVNGRTVAPGKNPI